MMCLLKLRDSTFVTFGLDEWPAVLRRHDIGYNKFAAISPWLALKEELEGAFKPLIYLMTASETQRIMKQTICPGWRCKHPYDLARDRHAFALAR